MADVADELQKRYSEAQAEMERDPSDLFNSGRALAFQGIVDIIENRMDVYNIHSSVKID